MREKLKGGKKFLTHKNSETLLNCIKIGKLGLGSCRPNLATVLHFRGTLTLVNVEVSMRSQVLIEVVQGVDHFICHFVDGSHIIVLLDSRVFCQGTEPPQEDIRSS